jgi:hypothetical protein
MLEREEMAILLGEGVKKKERGTDLKSVCF